MLDGVPEGIRTPDPQLRRLMLYPAELRAHKQNNSKQNGANDRIRTGDIQYHKLAL